MLLIYKIKGKTCVFFLFSLFLEFGWFPLKVFVCLLLNRIPFLIDFYGEGGEEVRFLKLSSIIEFLCLFCRKIWKNSFYLVAWVMMSNFFYIFWFIIMKINYNFYMAVKYFFLFLFLRPYKLVKVTIIISEKNKEKKT